MPESTFNNYKLNKSLGLNWMTAGMSMSPATESIEVGGRNMCPWSGACEKSCLKFAGRNRNAQSRVARQRRTMFRLEELGGFIRLVSGEIEGLKRKAAKEGMKVAYRPNVLSDDSVFALKLAEANPDVQFYDYTKIPKPWKRVRENYHLTYSLDNHNHAEALEAIENGINVAVAFDLGKDEPLPETWQIPGTDVVLPVINGDEHDLRFLDPVGVFVALKFKGSKAERAKAVAAGFVFSPVTIMAKAA